MAFTVPPHSPYPWHDKPATDTPLDSAHLEAAEDDLIAYTQQTAESLDSYSSGVYVHQDATGLPGKVVTASGSGGIPAWASGTVYAINVLVSNAGTNYICNTAHTSAASFASDAANWTALGSGGGSSTLAGDTDVSITSPANNQVLVYSSGTSKWVNASTPVSPNVVAGGSLGSTFSQALSVTQDTWLVGTLTANLALTLTGLASGARGVLLLTQDATGGRTLSVNSASVTISTAANALSIIDVFYDGTNLFVSVLGGGGSPPLALIQENVNAVATSGAAQTIPDVTSDTVNEVTLTANCTFTFPTGAAGKSFLLALTQDATGSRTVTWPATVVWSGGTAPTLTTTASKTDVFSFVWNSQRSKWIGFTAGQNF